MDKINQIWPAWHTVELIGRGGFGDVYKAKRELQGETFYSAVKVIQIPREEQDIREMMEEGHTSQSIRYYYESVAKDLMNEIKVLEALKSAGNVMNIEDFDIRERKEGIGWEVYIRMELLENLDAYRQRHTMTVQDVVKLGIDLCSALEYCEKSKIIHRDIKPKNIFVDGYGNYKLGDFGIARQMEKTQSTLSQKGTELYMAPEVRFGMSGSSYNVDIYSLGLVVYRLLNKNRMPFEPVEQEFLTYRDKETAIERRLKGEALPNPVDADEELSRIVRKACAFDKKERYQSASEMKHALEDWMEGREAPNREAWKKEQEEKEESAHENVQQDEEQGSTFQDEETVHFFEKEKADGGFYHYSFKKKEQKKKSERQSWQKEQDVIRPFPIFKIESMVGLSRVVMVGGKRIEVRIPKGVKEGQSIRIRGLGHPPDGDLYLNIAYDSEKAVSGLPSKEGILLQGLERYPGDLEAWVQLAKERCHNGMIRDARICYESMLEIDANHPEGLWGLGCLKAREEQYPEACRWYDRALKSAKLKSYEYPLGVEKLSAIYSGYALASGKCGELEKAKSLLEEGREKGLLLKEDEDKVKKELGIKTKPKSRFGWWKK